LIVVDTNVLAYLLLPGTRSDVARALLRHDPVWAAPDLWRSELRNVLAQYLHRGALDVDGAVTVMSLAEELLAGRTYQVPSSEVLRIVASTRLSAYDAEFVALAHGLAAVLVTCDQAIQTACPQVAVSPEQFVAA
jgi:predicted nucleic acid-binding protein